MIGGKALPATIMLALSIGAAHAVTPIDPFAEMVKVCAAKNPQGIPAAMTALHAEQLSTDETDRARLGQSIGLAYGVLHMDRPQADVDKETWPTTPEYFGWRLGRATLMSAGDPAQGQACIVSAPYDAFDATVALLKGMLAMGEPARDLKYGVNRVVAWQVEAGKPIPGIILVTADFGGERKPTYVQFLTK